MDNRTPWWANNVGICMGFISRMTWWPAKISVRDEEIHWYEISEQQYAISEKWIK